MSVAGEQLLVSTSGTELESLPYDPAPDNLSRRKERKYLRPSTLEPFKNAFRDAWNDLTSIQRIRQQSVSMFKSVEWRRVGGGILIIVWNLSLLALLICLALSFLTGLEGGIPCQPNGEFHYDLQNGLPAFNYWAASGFFEITLGWGRFNFATAKIIDVAWDLMWPINTKRIQVVGRGGQTIMVLISWRVFAEYLQVSIATKPATYIAVWLLRFQKDASAFSTVRLMSNFLKRGLASKIAMCFIVLTALFILAFPTFAGSMTGYTPYNEPYVTTTDGRLIRFSNVSLVAYVIHDGDRTKEFSKDYPVIWRKGASLPVRSVMTAISDYCASWENDFLEEDCKLQRDVSEYVQLYGFEASGGNQTANGHNQTKFRGQKIDWPPLNISASYLPPGPFYWNWTYDTGLQHKQPYRDPSKATYLIDDIVYNSAQLNDAGVCQPIKGLDSIQRYQWGFSFLQLLIMIVLLQLWSIGLLIMWINSHRTLRLNHHAAASQGWKGLLEFTDTIKLQLETANIDFYILEDEQLEKEIQRLLQGGDISSQPFSERPTSIWRWIWKEDPWILKVMFFIILIALDHTLRLQSLYALYRSPSVFDGADDVDMMVAESQAIVFSISYAILCLIVAFSVGTNILQRIITFLLTAGLCVPFFFCDADQRDLALPGVCVGACLALFIGSTRGSRIVLFTVPTCCNYFVVLALFIASANGPNDYHDLWIDYVY